MSGILQASVLKDSASATNNLALDASGNVTVGNNLTVTGSTTVAATTIGNLTYTGTLTGSTGILNIGSGQLYKNASGNVGIGNSAPTAALHVFGNNGTYGLSSFFGLNGSTPGVGIGNTGSLGLIQGLTTASGTVTDLLIQPNGGNLLVGTTTSGGKVFSYQNSATTNIGIDCGASMGGNAALWTRVASTSTVFSYYLYNATNVGSIATNGTSTAFNTSSDYRLKENVTPMTTGLATVGALKPVNYEWISDNSQGEGFIAHELQEVIPHAVTGVKDAIDDDGKPIYQGVDYSKIVVHLVAAIQELSAKNDALEARLAALENK